MMVSWRRLLLLCAAVMLTVLHRDVAATVDCTTGTGNLQNNYPLPQQSEARYLLPQETASNGIQVIVPQMAFGCSGRITAWSGHMLVLTKPNFIELLTHRIALQVWRPLLQEISGSFSLVGSNHLTFTDVELRNGITEVTGTNQSAFFTFTNKTIPEEEQIYFMAGDVIGWYVYPFQGSIDIPLSLLYRAPLRGDLATAVVDLQVDHNSPGTCVQCSETDQLGHIEDVVPMLSMTFQVGQQPTCSSTCNSSVSTPTEQSETTPTSTNGNNAGQVSSSQTTRLSASDITCIVIATVTLVLHVVLLLLCGLNCYVLKEIRGKLHSTAAMPMSMSMMKLAYKEKTSISNETPANYAPNTSSPTQPQEYERAQNSTSPYEMVDGNNRTHLTTKEVHHLRTNNKGNDSPAPSCRSDYSRDGSRLDLLKI